MPSVSVNTVEASGCGSASEENIITPLDHDHTLWNLIKGNLESSWMAPMHTLSFLPGQRSEDDFEPGIVALLLGMGGSSLADLFRTFPKT
jgi:hypothetical protein